MLKRQRTAGKKAYLEGKGLVEPGGEPTVFWEDIVNVDKDGNVVGYKQFVNPFEQSGGEK